MSLDLQIQQLDKLMDSMPALAAPSRPRSQRKYIVTSLYNRIQAFLHKNYTYEKICELIESVTGIFFKVTTLRKYLYLEKVRLSGGKLLRERRSRTASQNKRQNGVKSKTAASPFNTVSPKPEAKQKQSSTAVRKRPAQKPASPSEAVDRPAPAPAAFEPPTAGESNLSETFPADLDPAEDSTEPVVTPDPKAVSLDLEDYNPPAGGLLNEPRFNTMERD